LAGRVKKAVRARETPLWDVASAIVFILILIGINAAFIIAQEMYYGSMAASVQALPISSALLSVSFPMSVLLYLFGYRRASVRSVVSSLGLGVSRRTLLHLAMGVGIFFAMVLLEMLIAFISATTGVQINTNVSSIIGAAPAWFLVFTALVAPFDEEVLFRGFLVPRIGIAISALIFGILHLGYDSTFFVEVIAAVIFGLISGYAYRRTGSLYPSLLAHILVNTSTLLFAFAVIR
jgi:hypothetical protein